MIMRTLSFIFLLGAALTVHAQSDVYLNENFKDGIPADFVLKDYGNNPIVSSGFKEGFVEQTWSARAVGADDVHAAISTSRGEKEIAADKWMITPSLRIVSGDAWLSWDAKSVHYDLRDGYKVMISTTDQLPASFKEVYSIPEEDYFWAHHFVSLKEYQGKDIYVAFVNNSYNKYVLAITDLFVGVPSPGDFEVFDETPRFAGDVSTVAVTGKIRNIGGTVKLDRLECLTKDGQTFTQNYDNLTLEPGDSADYEFSLPVTLDKVSDYTLKVTSDVHQAKEILSDSVVCSTYPLTLVVEESTANWCNRCPMGTLYMHRLKKRYKDQIITIVSHSADPMEFGVYDKGLLRWIVDMPGMIYNRNSNTVYSPGWDTQFKDSKLAAFILKPVEAKIELTARYGDKDHTSIRTSAKACFAKSLDNSDGRYKLGYAIVEKTVKGYGQTNILTGASCGEYDFLPSNIPAELITFHDVVRGTESAFKGVDNSLPAVIEPGVDYEFDQVYEVPESVSTQNNVTVVVFIIDTKTRNILNACEVKTPVSHPESSVEELQGDVPEWIAFQSVDKQTIRVECTGEAASGIVTVRLIGLDGRSVYSTVQDATSGISIPAGGLKGCFIINLVAGNSTTSKKVVLN